ncbi:MAG: NADH-quinone oxidoreductase subunit C [Cytophagaceae bacterium]|jgi:NADH-quinone oxidoreductase subunit C|nr:NADH-quinone oxidoreductase subunit C [Cytophagaceae bacterium]
MALSNERIIERLQEKFNTELISSEISYDLLSIEVKRDAVLDIIRYLKEDKELNFIFLTDLTGVHYPDFPDGEKLGVIYHLHNLVDNVRLRVKALFPKESPFIESLTPVYSGANWMERETYDFFGIEFKHHPGLKRILNVDDLGYFPLRKEFALEDPTRDDKDDRFFGRGQL